MDFIERLFGVSPDNGSGLLEFAILMVPIVACVVALRFRARRRGKV